MAVRLKESFANDSDLTYVANGNATTAVSGNVLTTTFSAGNVTQEGARANTGVVIADGDRLYFAFKKEVHGAFFNFGGARGANISDGHWHFINCNDGTHFIANVWGSTFGSAVSMTTGTQYYGLVVYNNSGVLIYYKTGGWSDNLGDWTLLTTSSTAGIDEHGQTVYFKHYGGGQAAADVFKSGPYAFTDSNGLTPPAPTTLAVTAHDVTTISLSWDDTGTSTNETGLSIERSTVGSGSGFSEIATPTLGTESYQDTGLSPGTTYYYRIRSYITFAGQTFYSAYTSEVSQATDNDILLEDTFADESDITKFVTNGTVTNSSNTEVIDLPTTAGLWEGFYGNDTVTIDEEDNLHFAFKVNKTMYLVAGSTTGDNTNSNIGLVAQATIQSGTTIRGLFWGTLFGSGFTFSVNTVYDFLIIYGSERQGLYYKTGGYSPTLSDWTLISGIVETHDVGSSVRFVAAITAPGGSNYQATIYPYQFRDNSALVIDNAPAPTNLVAVPTSQNTILLTWTDNGAEDDETSIKIERSTTGGGVGFSQIASVSRGTTGYVSAGLTPSTHYYYRIRGDFSFGAIHHYSSYTSEADATTRTPGFGAQMSSTLWNTVRKRRKKHG